MTIKVICTGYREGEVIPVNGLVLSEQKRILDYLSNFPDAVKIGDAYELRKIIELKDLNSEVEIVGSIYNLCVASAIQIALQKGAKKIKVDPKKTIGILRLMVHEVFSEEEELEKKVEWFKKEFPKEGVNIKEKNGFLYFS